MTAFSFESILTLSAVTLTNATRSVCCGLIWRKDKKEEEKGNHQKEQGQVALLYLPYTHARDPQA